MKTRITILLGIAISAVVMGLLLARLDIPRMQQAFATAEYVYVLPAAGLLALGMFTRAIRWRALLMQRLAVVPSFSILSISYLFNGALPLRLGEVVRIFLASRPPARVPVVTTTSTIIVERLLDMLTVIGLLGGVIAVLDVPDSIASAGLMLGASAGGGLLVLIGLARWPGLAFGVLAWLERRLPWLQRLALKHVLARFLDGLAPLTSWRAALQVMGWTAVSWVLSVVAGYVLMYAFFPRASWVTTVLFIALASLAVSVPYAPGAVGPYEAGVVMALALTGFDQSQEAAVAFAIVLHGMTTGVFVVLGLWGLLQQGLGVRQIVRGARDMHANTTFDAGAPSGSARVE
ncbi:MAG: lysylphosphatidylglycerol synthase transmembrane domain-containing protein [Anaerolineae bacterium]